MRPSTKTRSFGWRWKGQPAKKFLTQIKVYYKIKNRDAYRLKPFLQNHLGIEAATLGEALLYTRDKKLVVILDHYMGRPYVKSTARMEE
jgi:hypothetical protein